MRGPIKRQTFEVLKQRGVPVATILDVGVLTGTPELIEAYPDHRHVLFEPVVEFREAIENNYRSVSYRLVSAAMSDDDGTIGLKLASNVEGIPISHSGMSSGPSERMVTMMKLDTYLELNPEEGPYLLKIDIDGEELRVIRGAEQTLRKTSIVVVETPIYAIAERIAAVESAGFTLIDLTEPCYYDEVLWQCDAVFIRTDLKEQYFLPIHPNFDPTKYQPFTG